MDDEEREPIVDKRAASRMGKGGPAGDGGGSQGPSSPGDAAVAPGDLEAQLAEVEAVLASRLAGG